MTTTTETAENTEEGTTNRIGAMHEAFAAYVNENTDQTVTAEQVFAVISNRVRFRKSESYLVGVKEAKEQERLEKIAEHEEAVAARKAKQAEEKAERDAAKEKAKAEREAAAKVKADEKAAKEAKAAEEKAAKDAKAAETTTTEAAPTTTKKKRAGAKSASADAEKASDAPF